MVGRCFKYIAVFSGVFAVLGANAAYAACTSPAGVAGEMGFNVTGGGEMEYCNDTSWTSMNNSVVVISGDGGFDLNGVDPTLVGPTLLGHWKLDETSGSSIADSSGNANTGTWSDNTDSNVSSETLVGKVDSALNFASSDGHIDIPEFTGTEGVSAITISAWIKVNSITDDVGTRSIVSKDRSGFLQWNFRRDGGTSGDGDSEICFEINADTSVDNCSTNEFPTDYEWHHVAAVYNGVDMRIYGDGVLINTPAAQTGNISSSYNHNICIGNEETGSGCNSTNIWNGLIDDVRIYDTALSADQVMELYTSGLGSLINHWKLDETGGITATDSVGSDDGTMEQDLSGADTVTGRIDTALEFAGTNQTQIVADSQDNMSNMTTCLWMKTDTFTNTDSDTALTLISKNSWRMRVVNATTSPIVEFAVSTSSVYPEVESSITLLTGQWYHICGVHNGVGTTPDLYINGADVGTDINSGTGTQTDDTANSVTIGASNSNNYFGNFPGTLDDIRVYDRSLSASEVVEIYNSGNAAPIGHWKLDETSGSSIADSSGNGNNGTWYDFDDSNVTGETVSGKIDTALHFDGSDDTIIIPDPDLIEGLTTMSVSAWVKSDVLNIGTTYTFVRQGGAGNDPFELEWQANENINFNVRNNSNATFSAVYTDGITDTEWHHIVGVYDGAEVRVYVDGVVGGTAAAMTDPIGTTTASIAIGNQDWDGIIDDVRIYDRVLSADEISNLLICSKPGEMGYNFASNVLQWCDSSLNIYNAGAAGAGGGGCAAAGTKAAGVEGTVQYDTTSNKMVFCDGASWVDIPN